MTTLIRLPTNDDAGAVAEIYRPAVETTASSFEIEAPGAPEMQRRMREALAFYPWLVCERDGRVVGYAYAGRYRVRIGYQWSVETSVYVHDDFRRRGVGQALYTSLFRILVAQGHVNAYAGIALPNAASVALHQSVGFAPIGVYRRAGFKGGAWHDVGWWALTLQPHPASPAPPVSVATVAADPGWPAWLAAGLPKLR
jgi:phosphinothricin acetyltransferase